MRRLSCSFLAFACLLSCRPKPAPAPAPSASATAPARPPPAEASARPTTPPLPLVPPDNHCAFPHGFRGTLGKSSLLLRLTTREAELGGHYFYEKHAVDIALSGLLLPRDGFRLDETSNGKVTGHFEGQCQASGHLTGQWTKPDGSGALAFDLAPIQPRSPLIIATKNRKRTLRAKKATEPYTDWVHNFDPGEPCEDSVSWPEIFGAETADAEDAINEALEQDAWAENRTPEELEGCRVGQRWSTTRSFDVEFDRPGILGVRFSGFAKYEGGTHTYDVGEWFVVTRDTKTGKAIEKETLLRDDERTRKTVESLLATCLDEKYNIAVDDTDGMIASKFIGKEASPSVYPTLHGLKFAAGGYPSAMREMEGDGPTVSYAALLAAGALRPDSAAAVLWKGVKPDSSRPCGKDDGE